MPAPSRQAAKSIDELPKRTKAYALTRIQSPDATYAEIAERHGVSPQNVYTLLADENVRTLVQKQIKVRADKASSILEKSESALRKIVSQLDEIPESGIDWQVAVQAAEKVAAIHERVAAMHAKYADAERDESERRERARAAYHERISRAYALGLRRGTARERRRCVAECDRRRD